MPIWDLSSSCCVQNPENKQKMAAELVDAATSTNLAEMDWGKNIEICELAANDQKYVLETFQLVILWKLEFNMILKII